MRSQLPPRTVVFTLLVVVASNGPRVEHSLAEGPSVRALQFADDNGTVVGIAIPSRRVGVIGHFGERDQFPGSFSGRLVEPLSLDTAIEPLSAIRLADRLEGLSWIGFVGYGEMPGRFIAHEQREAAHSAAVVKTACRKSSVRSIFLRDAVMHQDVFSQIVDCPHIEVVVLTKCWIHDGSSRVFYETMNIVRRPQQTD